MSASKAESGLPTPLLPETPPRQWLPRTLKPMTVLGLVALMILYAVIVEVLLVMSNRNSGFGTQEIDRINALQFIDSFLPVIAVLPVVWIWTKADQELRRLHPYVVISQGNASADKSVLLDYIGNGRIAVLFQSLTNGHFLILFSGAIVLLSMMFQPLAAGLFGVRLVEVVQTDQTVNGTGNIGIRPDFADLNSFAAAAGYAEAASVHGLGDPPFIFGGWSVGKFDTPPGLPPNSSVHVFTNAIQTNANCFPAESLNAIPTPTGFTVRPTWQGCSVNIPIASGTQTFFSVTQVDNCGAINGQLPPIMSKPVVFNFFHLELLVGRSVFCQPKIQLFNVEVEHKLSTGLLSSVNITGDYTGSLNSVSALGGRGFNAVFFNTSTDPFVNARSLAIQSGVPGAIFRKAQDYPGGLGAALSNETFMLNLTNTIYTQHLAISAAEVYFLKTRSPIEAEYRLWQPRLVVYAPAAHSLAALFLFIAAIAVGVHFSHWRARRNLLLSGPPGTIANAVSLTSQARFGALLNATDTPKDMSKKLKGLLFGIDPATWQIVVEGEKGSVQDPLLNKSSVPGSPVPKYNSRESYFGSLVSPGPSTSRDSTFPRDSKLVSPGLVPPSPGLATHDQKGPQGPRLSTTSLQPPPASPSPASYFPSGPGAYADPWTPPSAPK